MFDVYDDHWRSLRTTVSLQVALILSFALHAGAGVALAKQIQRDRIEPKPISIAYEVQFLPTPIVEEEVEEIIAAPPPPPPPPKPKPPPPKKKEEPKKKKEEPKKIAKKKKEEPKKKPPEKKVEKKKKPDPPKQVVQQPPKPKPEVVAKAQPRSGVQQQQLPPMLNSWGRSVQRKVEKKWRIPGGIQLSEENSEVHISFWVGRDGFLKAPPEIIKDAHDPAIGMSGINAILAAEPLPPLPVEYPEKVQQVVYVFSLIK